jgi:hypothetical protein
MTTCGLHVTSTTARPTNLRAARRMALAERSRRPHEATDVTHRCLLLLTAFAAVCGCSTSQKEGLIDTALDDPGRRKESFEATLRVLDENPEYTDELFALARNHPQTLDRFLANATTDMKDVKLARLTADHLVQHPDSLHQILISTLDAAQGRPESRQAIARAIEDRATHAAGVISDRPSAVDAVLEATVKAVLEKPEARAAFVGAMHRLSPTLAAILANNPKTLRAMAVEILRAGFKNAKGDLDKLVQEATQ